MASLPLGLRTDHVMLPVSILVLVLSLLLGAVFGDVQSFTFLFGTAYGITFLIAFLVTAVLILWGNLVSGHAVRRLNAIPLDAMVLAEGKMSTTYVAQMRRVRLFTLLELLGLQFAPRIRDLGEQRLYRMNRTKTYQHIVSFNLIYGAFLSDNLPMISLRSASRRFSRKVSLP